MSSASDRSYKWVFYTAAGFLFVGVLLRALLVAEEARVLVAALLLLLGWLVLFVIEPVVRRKWTSWSVVYLVLQTAAVIGMLLLPGDDDFYVALFAVLSMQALQRFGVWPGVGWLALFAVPTFVLFLGSYPPAETAALTVVYTALNVLLGSYALASVRAGETRDRNRALARELETTNDELRGLSERLERLAVARERNRLARELHDSVTQTIFSMTLAGQVAILVQREPAKLEVQLDRLRELAEGALAEMRALVSELRPDAPEGVDLIEGIRRDIEWRKADGVTVSFQVEEPATTRTAQGTVTPALSAVERSTLLRIAQEALNNVVKHSGSKEAVIILRLGERPSLEIRDKGAGFDLERAKEGLGMGLTGMRERAAEIGWTVDINTGPGAGTRILVERPMQERGEG
ncbi:MAG: sensor histidine kinase [Thermoleophilia bacterium]|nr:sensor histidine kinase [Thermoleophilia bacterium]